jgi:hypothetical protein
MLTESKSPNKFADVPSDKPQGDRVEHANLERPGAQAHPRAKARTGDWSQYTRRAAWQWH